MSWADWLALAAWLVFGPLYIRAAWREALKEREEREARLHGRRQEHDDEDLANP